MKQICTVLDDKKASDITVIDVSEMTIVAEYFVIASAGSNTAVKALCGAIEEKMENFEVKVIRTEGMKEGRWVAMDYGSVIVHVFHYETRQFYQLERLWIDGANSLKYPEDKDKSDIFGA